MVKPELVVLIKEQVLSGTDKENIVNSLAADGFERQDIEDSFITATAEPTEVMPSEVAEFESAIGKTEVVSPDGGDSKLKAGELFKKSWELYKSRWKTFLGVTLVPTIISLIIGTLFLLSGAFSWITPQNLHGSNAVLFFIMIMVISIPLMILQLWEEAALVYAIKGSEEKIGVAESYRRGRTKIKAFFWVSVLSSLIVCGGFLLLIIPGIILSLWFSFAGFIIIDEDFRGMDALLKSREYIRGRGWQLFWLIIGLLPYMILTAIILSIASSLIMGFFYLLIPDGTIADISTMLFKSMPQSENTHYSYKIDFTFLLAPLITAYTYYIYRAFKRDKGEFVFAPTAGTKNKYMLLAVLGVLFFIAIMGLFFSFAWLT